MAPRTVLFPSNLEVLMLRYSPFVLLIASSLFSLSCADDTVVQTGSIEVQWDRTRSSSSSGSDVQRRHGRPRRPRSLPDSTTSKMAFNDMVNELIIEAMQEEPVCLTLDPTDDVPREPAGPLGGERTRSDDGRRLLLRVRRRLVVGLLGLVLGLLRVLASDLRRVGRRQPAHPRRSAAGRRARIQS